jgi:hypothetical protein
MTKLYFKSSNYAILQITELYDFIWPTTSAIWNLRWQVKGFVNEIGATKLKDEDINNRFDWGSGIYGVNLKKACLETSWDIQQEQFAKILLINLCAIFDGWIEEMQESLNFSSSIRNKLMLPDCNDDAIRSIKANKSEVTKNAFYSSMQKNKKYSIEKIKNLLICYKYFKENVGIV